MSALLAHTRRRLAQERGNVVVIATMVIALMIALGLSAYSTVDTQTDQSRRERVRESTFNLAEGALNAQTFVLARKGTGTSDPNGQFPTQCPATPANDLCPNAAELAKSFDSTSQADYNPATTTWTTEIHDNLAAPNQTTYSSAVDSQPRWDANDDNQLWVKATATLKDRSNTQQRTIVALIKVEDRNINFPAYSISAGFFYTTNSGNKVIVDSSGSLGVTVRCNAPPPDPSCLGYDPNKGQLVPPSNYALNYQSQTAITADDLQALEDYAKARGTYYSSCPSNPNGEVVVVEVGNCTYNDSSPAASGETRCCNTGSKPGLLIIKNGTLVLNGNITFHGLVYMPNLQGSTGAVVTTGGTALIDGGVTIDGKGGLASGSSGLNIKFNNKIFNSIVVTGTAGVVQNTWREIPDD